MSYLLWTLGRGLVSRALDVFGPQLPGDADEDADALLKRLGQSPTSVDLLVRHGVARLRNMRIREARASLRRALEIEAESRPALLSMACLHDELGELDDSIALLDRAGALDPSDPAVDFVRGQCYERQGEFAAAREAYERSHRLCPRLRNPLERLAAIAVAHGEWSAAHECYERISALETENLDVLTALGVLRLRSGDAEAAVDAYQRALLVEPDASAEALEGTELSGDEQQLRRAVRTLETLVEKYPAVTEFRVHLADLYVKFGDDPAATEQYRAALELHPDFLEAAVKLGTQHLRAGRYGDAARQFVRAADLNDRLLAAFVGLGVAQHESGRAQESLATFDLAASLAPNTTLLFSETARLHLKSQGPSASAASEREEDDAAGEFGVPTSEGEDLLFDVLRRHRAALASRPLEADLHYRYGLLLQQIGDLGAAVSEYQAAAAISPTFPQAQTQLAIALRNTGRLDDAVRAFRQAVLADDADVALHYRLGLLFSRRSQFELAMDQCEFMLQGEPASATLRENIELALANIGMVNRADAAWRGVCDLCCTRSAPADRFGTFRGGIN